MGTKYLTSRTLKEQKKEFETLLGVNVSEEVFKVALLNPNYANDLLVTRGSDKYQKYLLDNPPALPERHLEEISATDLVISATKSLALWAKTGFSTVSEEKYQDRLQKCSVCPYLTTPPSGIKGLLYTKVDKGICGKCGCPIASKARLSSEQCPATDPNNSTLTRWGETIKLT